MLTAILGVLASLGPWGSAAAAYLGYQKQKDSELNDPAHIAAVEGNADQKLQAQLETDLNQAKKTGDLAPIRKDQA